MTNNIAIFPRFSRHILASKTTPRRANPNTPHLIPRRELQRLIADMID
ncbi:MAG TPA: hypothetical protein VFG34_06905 [Sphingopyxis sp.]|nr:hypothetical protein [Sphingopyxis sp.]